MSNPRLTNITPTVDPRNTGNIVKFRLTGLRNVLVGPTFVATKKGDMSLPFHPLAGAIFTAFPYTAIVRLEKVTRIIGNEAHKAKVVPDEFTISVQNRLSPQAPPPRLDPLAIQKTIAGVLTQGAPFKERALMAKLSEPQTGAVAKLTTYAQAYMQQTVLPEMQRLNPKHAVDIRVERVLPTGNENEYDVGVTLHQDCATCQASLLKTVNGAGVFLKANFFGSASIQDTFPSAKMRHVVVVPTKDGSPFMTHAPKNAKV